jgi:hypothetical protein
MRTHANGPHRDEECGPFRRGIRTRTPPQGMGAEGGEADHTPEQEATPKMKIYYDTEFLEDGDDDRPHR